MYEAVHMQEKQSRTSLDKEIECLILCHSLLLGPYQVEQIAFSCIFKHQVQISFIFQYLVKSDYILVSESPLYVNLP